MIWIITKVIILVDEKPNGNGLLISFKCYANGR